MKSSPRLSLGCTSCGRKCFFSFVRGCCMMFCHLRLRGVRKTSWFNSRLAISSIMKTTRPISLDMVVLIAMFYCNQPARYCWPPVHFNTNIISLWFNPVSSKFAEFKYVETKHKNIIIFTSWNLEAAWYPCSSAGVFFFFCSNRWSLRTDPRPPPSGKTSTP